MMVQFTGLSLSGLLFICSSHSRIEIHGPGRQATAPNRKGGVAVSLTTSQRLEFRSESPYSSDPNSENISDLRKRGGVCGGQSGKTGIFVDWEPLEKVRRKSCTFVFAKSMKS